jgi:urea transport system substrate-binding protein
MKKLKIYTTIVCVLFALVLNANAAKIGILHSLSGTMAISETSLRDVVLMAVEEINNKGGVLGEQIEPVVVDPASNWPLFAEKAKQMITEDKVAVTFGCWTSVSRKSVLPVFEEYNALLFYPVQYEGEEQSLNVFYTGATPNQQLIPAAEYMSKELGMKQFYLLGTDYVFPRTANKVLKAYLLANGVPEDELRAMDVPPLVGHLAAWNYFQTQRKRSNLAFVRNFKKYCAKNNLPGGRDRVTDDPIEAAYFGVYVWAKACEKAGSFDVDKVREAVYGLEFDAPGGPKAMHESNQHTKKPVLIGEIKKNGQFKIVYETPGLVSPDSYSPYLHPGGKIPAPTGGPKK